MVNHALSYADENNLKFWDHFCVLQTSVFCQIAHANVVYTHTHTWVQRRHLNPLLLPPLAQTKLDKQTFWRKGLEYHFSCVNWVFRNHKSLTINLIVWEHAVPRELWRLNWLKIINNGEKNLKKEKKATPQHFRSFGHCYAAQRGSWSSSCSQAR